MSFHGRYFGGRVGELPDYGDIPPDPVGIPPPGEYQGTSVSGLSDRQSQWNYIIFTVGLTAIKVQDYLLRKFFLIQNKSGANSILVGFGYIPDANTGLLLGAGVGFEPYSYPVNEIYVVATGAGTQGLIIYGV